MALRTEHVTRQFLRKRGNANVFNAVDDVTLTLENGKVTVITGPSGSGKSTLLNMMAGILTPTSGNVMIGDTDLYKLDDAALSVFRNEHIGMIPQGQTPIYSLNVMDNVLLPYTIHEGKKHRTTAERAAALLQQTGIADLADVMPQDLSGGELRRMAIARAMLLKPDVILADEPTADLDEENTQIVLSMMQKAAEEGSAVLIVTHDKDVFPWADRVLELRNGRLDGMPS